MEKKKLISKITTGSELYTYSSYTVRYTYETSLYQDKEGTYSYDTFIYTDISLKLESIRKLSPENTGKDPNIPKI
jgi:hypothetical protein